MDIITLRNVGPFEIPDSFRGILRISPNNGNDDASPLLSTEGSRIQLSDSEGILLPLTFVTKSIKSKVIGRESEINLINVIHEYNILHVSNTLNVRPTLYLEPKQNEIPLLFVNDGNSLGYPLEAPENLSYFNRDNQMGFEPDLSLEENISKHVTSSKYKNIPKSEKITINGEPIYRYITNDESGITEKVQDFTTRTAVLGVYPRNTYKQSRANTNVHSLSKEIHNGRKGIHTQLSYISLDDIIWRTLEMNLTGVYRSYNGRYFNLSNKTSDNLGKKLFGDDFTLDKLKAKGTGPIMNIGVQSGTIHYNAIPAHRYFFHTVRRYGDIERGTAITTDANITKADIGAYNHTNILVRQYVLCDGKDITSEYPHIDMEHLKTWAWTDTHKAIAKSTSEISTTFTTPPLFECDQYAPRFLRGLNWLRNEEAGFINNEKIYKKVETDINDPANHAKNINKVGMYYANYDYDLQKTYEHAHALFAHKSGGGVSSLNNEKKILGGVHNSEVPNNVDGWEKYINGESDSFYNSQMLKTVGGLRKIGKTFSKAFTKKLQMAPITVKGETYNTFHTLVPCFRVGKKKLGICIGRYKTYCRSQFTINDGSYVIAKNYRPNTLWRLRSSLPVQNKYGKSNSLDDVLSYIQTENETKNFIDDSLPTPPAMNFIPLMKI